MYIRRLRIGNAVESIRRPVRNPVDSGEVERDDWRKSIRGDGLHYRGVDSSKERQDEDESVHAGVLLNATPGLLHPRLYIAYQFYDGHSNGPSCTYETEALIILTTYYLERATRGVIV